MAQLTLNRVSARYPGADHLALRDVSLQLGPGQLVVVLGPSTLMRVWRTPPIVDAKACELTGS